MGRVWKVLLVAAVLVAGNLVFSSASAGGGGDRDRGDRDRGTTIWLKAKSVELAEIDTDGSGGPSLGDQTVFSDDLYLRKQKVGTLDGFCTLQRLADPSTVQCLVTATVDGAGQIAHQGSVRLGPDGLPPRFVLPITGGSGDFVGAEGQTKLIPRSETVVLLKVMLTD